MVIVLSLVVMVSVFAAPIAAVEPDRRPDRVGVPARFA
jgi:hypothetical protein